jgi:hypothetical protein
MQIFRIILCSERSWADQVNRTVQGVWNAFHFVMCVLKKGNSNTKRLAYMLIVRTILEYGASCWDPYREGQINALDCLQKKATEFANHINNSVWGNLGPAQNDSLHLRPVQCTHRKTGREIYRGQVKRTMCQ